MKQYIMFIFLVSILQPLKAQKKIDERRWSSILTKEQPAEIRMSAQLYQLAILATSDAAEANARLSHSTLRHRNSDSTVNIEIVYRLEENQAKIKDEIDSKYLSSLGFKIDQTWKNRASIWVPLSSLLKLSSRLSKDYFIQLVTRPPADNEGPAAVNSVGYKTGGATGGAGKKVAIFDYGFAGMQSVINSGNAKMPVYIDANGTATNLAGVDYSGQQHGTSCVETIFDHAPNADYELYAVDNATERGNAVNKCIAHGVNVISMAISEYNTGWDDNSGPACAYANAAANAGILFITSVGNRATNHYQGMFKDANNNNIHEFSGTDEKNKLVDNLDPGYNAHCYLSWNTALGSDFDIYIFRVGNDVTPLASSAMTGTTAAAYEYVSYTNNTGSSMQVYFRVVKKSGPATNFEMFTAGSSDYQYMSIPGSSTSPSNSTHPNVISVGAVVYDYFDYPSGTEYLIAGYSSQGPTNSGNIAPKIAGPTLTSTFISGGGGFGGTSGSTANVAGAITSFWSANPYLDATGVAQIILRTSQLYKDWGAAGPDNVYGYGGLQLFSWEPNLRYIYRLPENSAVTNATRPFFSLQTAQNNAPDNSKVIILNSGNFIETGTYGNSPATGSGKKILYVSPFTHNGNFGF